LLSYTYVLHSKLILLKLTFSLVPGPLPSPIDLCCFKVSALVPLHWGHQMLSCWGFFCFFGFLGFLAYPRTSLICFSLPHVIKVQSPCCVCLWSKAWMCFKRYLCLGRGTVKVRNFLKIHCWEKNQNEVWLMITVIHIYRIQWESWGFWI
jgi:hypothetical protein